MSEETTIEKQQSIQIQKRRGLSKKFSIKSHELRNPLREGREKKRN